MAGGEPSCMIYDAVQDCRDRTAVKRREECCLYWAMAYETYETLQAIPLFCRHDCQVVR